MLSKNNIKPIIFFTKILVVLGITASVFIGLPVFQKNIAISIDGVDNQLAVAGLYVEDVIHVLDDTYGAGNYQLDAEPNLMGFITDMNSIGIYTKKIIKIKHENKEETVTTYVPTIKAFIQEKQFPHQLENVSVLDEQLTSDISLEERIIEENFPVEVVENPDLEKGVENTLQEGSNKVISELYSIVHNKNVKVGTKIMSEGQKKIIEKGTKVVSKAPTVPTDSVWDKLAACESGGRWNLNTGNGYYGGLQFSAATWRTASKAVGLNIEYAHQATREEQIMAATWLQQKSGWGQWPACSSKLGL